MATHLAVPGADVYGDDEISIASAPSLGSLDEMADAVRLLAAGSASEGYIPPTGDVRSGPVPAASPPDATSGAFLERTGLVLLTTTWREAVIGFTRPLWTAVTDALAMRVGVLEAGARTGGDVTQRVEAALVRMNDVLAANAGLQTRLAAAEARIILLENRLMTMNVQPLPERPPPGQGASHVVAPVGGGGGGGGGAAGPVVTTGWSHAEWMGALRRREVTRGQMLQAGHRIH